MMIRLILILDSKALGFAEASASRETKNNKKKDLDKLDKYCIELKKKINFLFFLYITLITYKKCLICLNLINFLFIKNNKI